MARDHLADQAEREELEADDDEQDAQGQQRPLADRLAGRLEHRQIDEDSRSQQAQDEPEAAE